MELLKGLSAADKSTILLGALLWVFTIIGLDGIHFYLTDSSQIRSEGLMIASFMWLFSLLFQALYLFVLVKKFNEIKLVIKLISFISCIILWSFLFYSEAQGLNVL